LPRRAKRSGACASASDIPVASVRPSPEEQRAIEDTIVAGADAIEEMLRDGAQIAMNKLHSRGRPAAGAKPE
jgi:hypothetical protein